MKMDEHNYLWNFKKYPVNKKISDLLDKAHELKISSGQFNDNKLITKSYLLKKIFKRHDLAILETHIDFDKIFTKEGISNNYENIIKQLIGRSEHNGKTYIDKFITLLQEQINQRKKNIFVYIDYHNYLLTEKSDSKSGYNEKTTHAICYILHRYKNKYYTFVINDHGQAFVNEDWKYKKYLSRTRFKEVPLEKPLDYTVMELYFNTINKYLNNTVIYYELTDKCNYQGPNMQSGDNYGICFIFPFLIFIELCCNYSNAIISSQKSLSYYINYGNMTKATCIIMEKYIKRPNSIKKIKELELSPETYFNTYCKGFTNYLIKKNTFYVKLLLFNIINYINSIN